MLKLPSCVYEFDPQLAIDYSQFLYNYKFYCFEKPEMLEKLKEAVKNGDDKFISTCPMFQNYLSYKGPVDCKSVIYTIDDVKEYIEKEERDLEVLKPSFERRYEELTYEIKQCVAKYRMSKIDEDFI
jgi:hypothetical protein